MGAFRPTGVAPRLVEKVRAVLDRAGHERVRIVASGGFDVERIGRFARDGVPVDAYGVGSSPLRGANEFTADIVLVGGGPCGKAGRSLHPSPRLSRVA